MHSWSLENSSKKVKGELFGSFKSQLIKYIQHYSESKQSIGNKNDTKQIFPFLVEKYISISIYIHVRR